MSVLYDGWHAHEYHLGIRMNKRPLLAAARIAAAHHFFNMYLLRFEMQVQLDRENLLYTNPEHSCAGFTVSYSIPRTDRHVQTNGAAVQM